MNETFLIGARSGLLRCILGSVKEPQRLEVPTSSAVGRGEKNIQRPVFCGARVVVRRSRHVSVSPEHLQGLGTGSQPFHPRLPRARSLTGLDAALWFPYCSQKRTNQSFTTSFFFTTTPNRKRLSGATAFSVISFLDTAGDASVLQEFGLKQTPAGCWSQKQQARRGVPPRRALVRGLRLSAAMPNTDRRSRPDISRSRSVSFFFPFTHFRMPTALFAGH